MSKKLTKAMQTAARYSTGGRTRIGMKSARQPIGRLLPSDMVPADGEVALGTAAPAEQIIPDRGYKLKPWKKYRARVADGGSVADPYNPLEGIDPGELMKIRAGVAPPSDKPDHELLTNQIMGVLEALPVTGNLLSAKDAGEAGYNAVQAAREGRWRDAGIEGGISAISGLGALSPVPWGRQAGRAAREGKDAVRVFVGAPEGKRSDLAREMREAGEPRARIMKETNRWFGPEGALKQEISDRGSRIKRAFAVDDLAPMKDVVDNPQLYIREPQLAEIPVRFMASSNPKNPHSLGGARAVQTAQDPSTGGFRISAGFPDDETRAQLAKMMNYRLAEKYGFGSAVNHSRTAVRDQFQDAFERANLLPPGPNRDAYLERVAAKLRDFDKHEYEALLDAQKTTSGNIDSRLVRARAVTNDANAKALGKDPFSSSTKYVGSHWDRGQVVPYKGADMQRFVDDWATYGIGKPGFAAGGRVARGMKRAKVVIGAMTGNTPGRADKLPVSVPEGAYVIPADIVAALGDGNTNAGMSWLEKQLGTGGKFARGGQVKAVPILISDGEYVVSPEAVAAAGGPDRLDAFVTYTRQAYVDHLKGLDGPNQ